MGPGARACVLLVSIATASVAFASLSLASGDIPEDAPAIENPLTVVKQAGPPRSSAVTRSFTSDCYGEWTHWIINSGLRMLTIDVFDVTMGDHIEVMHLRLKFATHESFPAGRADLPGLIVGKGRSYEITLIPIGHKGAAASYYYLEPCWAPFPVMTVVTNGLHVDVDGSASYDRDGIVVSHTWDWGDGSTFGSGATASHDYGAAGLYTLKLTVTDNDGLTGTTSMIVNITIASPMIAQSAAATYPALQT